MKSFWQLIVGFLRGLFSEDGGVSSKRVAAILCIVACVTAFLSNLYFKFVVNEPLFNALLLFAAACLGMNTFLSAKGISVKETVASGVVDSAQPGANEDAKDILQADKP